MWITYDRVFYVGLLGMPSERTMGAIVLYVSLNDSEPLRLSVDGAHWQTANIAVVQPYVPHRVSCDSRHIAVLKIEPETVDLAKLPVLLQSDSGPLNAPEFRAHVLRCHSWLIQNGQCLDGRIQDFDELLFGADLPTRAMDARIVTVLESIRRDPAGHAAAQKCADQVYLSFSRFLHLFRNEVGTPFRSFRSWKRARSFLRYVHQSSTLTDVALDAGYSDSTHFSHAIRQAYGLKPSEMIAGFRRLRIFNPSP